MDYLRTALIFVHLMVFAFAITTLFKSDVKLLFQRPNDDEVHTMGNHMLFFLLLLWVTGLGIIWIDTKFDYDVIINAPKIVVKLSCVILLTLNALIIHFVAFKKLKKAVLSKADMYIMSLSGSISTASWTFAAFLGVAKPLVKHLTMGGFFGLYAFVLVSAMTGAVLLTPMIRKNWDARSC